MLDIEIRYNSDTNRLLMGITTYIEKLEKLEKHKSVSQIFTAAQ